MKYIYLYIFLFFQLAMSQQDFSDQWQDIYSYSNVKDFTIIDSKLYAIVNNAMFVYDIETNETQKFSSVNGLSGTSTSSISFDEVSGNIIIGYENGLIEIISNDNSVVPVTGIRDNVILVDKVVKGAYRYQNQSYVYGGFGIVELDVDNSEFGDYYRLSNTTTPYSVNKLVVENSILYAATNNGLYYIDLSLNAIDFNNWTKLSDGEVTDVVLADDKMFYVIGVNIYEKSNPSTSVLSLPNTIHSLGIDNLTGDIIVTTSTIVEFYDVVSLAKTNELDLSLATNYSFTTTKALVNNNDIFLNTSSFGVLKTTLTDKVNYQELHPAGPSANDIFEVTITNQEKWVVYGGHDISFNALNKTSNIDYFFNNQWNYIPYTKFSNTRDCVKAIVDPIDNSKVLIASIREGIVEINDFNFVKKWTNQNTNNVLPGHASVDQTWTANMIVDKNNKIWTANSRAKDNLYFSCYNGTKEGADRWESNVDFSSVIGSKFIRGFNKMYVDLNNNVYAASARSGLFVFNANSVADETNRNVTILDDLSNNGQLPSSYVFSVVVDENNRIWIGTGAGLVVFNDYDNLYATTKNPATTLIIEEDGAARELLAETQVNDIIIDLSGNKWFATQEAGVIQTSSDGQTTFNTFNISNSPLPSNTVIDLELDEETGLIYMVTENGMLAYDSKNEPFGENITDVIAYPNPAIRNRAGHEYITIVAKDGNGIPDGTNVKIMDVSGKLVYETNVSSSNGAVGGKVVWDKKNIRGNSVVSGVYIVLLSSADGSENTTTKIAIVN